MAINQQPISRSITLPATNVSTGQGLNQLASATSTLSNLVSERLNNVAIEQAALQGEQDVQNENAPDKLSLPFTRATKAYNKAVTDTEARRLIASAENLINESLLENKNPATFNRETPAKFNAELNGIKSGVLQNTRAENREFVREHLDKMTAHASLNMLAHSIEYDNKQTKFDFKQDIEGLLESRRNASLSGDEQRVAGIDSAIDKTLSDYSVMNAEIAQLTPYLRADIEKSKAVDTTLGAFARSLEDGTSSKFMSDLANNKEKLPFSTWQEAVKGVVALDQEHKRLNNQSVSEQVAQIKLGINNGSIQDAGDILNYDIPTDQKLTLINELQTAQAKQFKENSDFITAQQNILFDRASWNSADTKNKMFESQIRRMEQETGEVATLQKMEQSVLGEGAYPASGMPDTPMGANVPAFDSTVSQKLVGKDPIATAQAAMVYNDMVNIKDKPNSINITGDALAVANLFNEINRGGTPPEEAAQQAINTVLNAKEPEVAQRIDRFHKTLEKVNPSTGLNPMADKFKSIFGVKANTFGADEAFKVFQDEYRANYLLSNSEEAALKATKYSMRNFGTSKYFDKGYVGNPVPEKELPIAKIGHSLDNQIVSSLQLYIDRTKAAREANPDLNIPIVEWANPKQAITFKESGQAKVFDNWTYGRHPKIKINGHETDVVLMPSSTSRLDNGVNYLFGVYDKFNNLHPLADPTNRADQVVRFKPLELSVWAPDIATKQTDAELRKVAQSIQKQEFNQDEAELKALNAKLPELQLILGMGNPQIYRDYIASRDASTMEGRLNKIIESLKGAASSEKTRNEIIDAENIGVSSSLEPAK